MQRKTPAIPPASSTVATALQPNYRKWRAVRVGMSRADVAELLGEALTGREQRPITFRDKNYPAYGFISYPALPNKWAMLFVLGFDKNDRVWWKSDPFGGSPLSRSGKPSKPQIIAPRTGSSFDHYPRLLDVRWFPSSGVYPIVYELELGLSMPGGDQYRANIDPHRYGQPYALLSFPGAQPGRVRVRGRNARGVGAWSEYVEFAFEV
jgi:hypothetical protein